jgi:hypothetical protein
MLRLILSSARDFRRSGSISIKKQFQSRVRGSVIKGLPYGLYRLRIAAPGFKSVERVVTLDRPEISVRAQLQVFIECGADPAEISGSVNPARDERPRKLFTDGR